MMKRFIKPVLIILTLFLVIFVFFLLVPFQENQRNLSAFCKTEERSRLLYQIYFGRIPLGHFVFQTESRAPGKNLVQAVLEMRPPALMRKLSSDRIALDAVSTYATDTFLPISFSMQNLRAKHKGKAPKSITYNHEKLYIERKGRKEDIWDDTRDFVSLLAWMQTLNYSQRNLIKSTLNINRDIYVVVGKNEGKVSGFYKIRLRLLKVNERFDVENTIPLTAYFLPKGPIAIPVLFKFRLGPIPVTVVLK